MDRVGAGATGAGGEGAGGGGGAGERPVGGAVVEMYEVLWILATAVGRGGGGGGGLWVVCGWMLSRSGGLTRDDDDHVHERRILTTRALAMRE